MTSAGMAAAIMTLSAASLTAMVAMVAMVSYPPYVGLEVVKISLHVFAAS